MDKFFSIKELSIYTASSYFNLSWSLQQAFYSKSMSYADEIITISKTVDEYVLKIILLIKKNLHLIYRGCDLEEFNTSDLAEKWKKDWFDKFPQTRNKTLLTLPGRITSWKGIESFYKLN